LAGTLGPSGENDDVELVGLRGLDDGEDRLDWIVLVAGIEECTPVLVAIFDEVESVISLSQSPVKVSYVDQFSSPNFWLPVHLSDLRGAGTGAQVRRKELRRTGAA
jgi:hypothetical protein